MPVMADQPAYSIANSDAAFTKAKLLMPGGVSSPVRAFAAVGGTPPFIKEAVGCHLSDIDSNKYIDYVGSYGPMILGHANDEVVAALAKAIGRGWSYGAPTEQETQLASVIAGAIPSVEMIRFVNSGTEATMSAVRLARAATERDLIVKCIGGYHGHADSFLVAAGSGALTLGTPSSPGVPRDVASATLLVEFNDLTAAEALFQKYVDRIACFIIEPIPGNMGVVPPAPEYLLGLRQLCDRHKTLLIFDEVMSGFRVAWGGAQTLYGIRPDLTCLGKVIGGGMPVGAYGGSRQLMERISPSGPVYQAGTLSGNPVAMAGGLATLQLLKEEGTYDQLEKTSAALADGLTKAAVACGVPLTVNRVGSMLTPFFVREPGQPVSNHQQATACDTQRYAAFFHAMLEGGVYLPPSQFEAWFVSLAHDEQAVEQTLTVVKDAFAAIKAL